MNLRKLLNVIVVLVTLFWGFNASPGMAQEQKTEKPCVEKLRPRKKVSTPVRNMAAPPSPAPAPASQLSFEQMKELLEAAKQPVTVTVNTPPAPVPIVTPPQPQNEQNLDDIRAKLDAIGGGVTANGAKLDSVMGLEKSNNTWIKVDTGVSALGTIFSGILLFRGNPKQAPINVDQSVVANPVLTAQGGNASGSTANAGGGSANATGGAANAAGGAGGTGGNPSATATGGTGGAGGQGGSLKGSGNSSSQSGAGASAGASANSSSDSQSAANANGDKQPPPPTCPNPKGGKGKH